MGSIKKLLERMLKMLNLKKPAILLGSYLLISCIVEETLTDICAEETGNTTCAVASSVLVVYFYVQYSLFKEKKAEKYHYIDFLTAAFPADFLIGDGCYAIGCSSMKEACKLDPDNVAYKEDLLQYYDRVPGDKGTYLSEEEAKSIREEINALNG